jgi:hypothetical protein
MTMSDKLYASDEECRNMRDQLISAGRVVPKSADSEAANASASLDVEAPSARRRVNVSDIPDEGVYVVRPITSDEEYDRRKRNYMIMLQSILRARKELKLEFEDQKKPKKR